MLAIALLHAVAQERYPAGPTLGDEDPEARVAVQCPRGHHQHGRSLTAVGRVRVVQHRATGSSVHGVLARVTADVEGGNHADVLERGPQGLPRLTVEGHHRRVVGGRVRVGWRGHRHRVEAELAGPDGRRNRIVDVEQRNRRRSDESVGRDALDLGHLPLVFGLGRGTDQGPVVDGLLPEPNEE